MKRATHSLLFHPLSLLLQSLSSWICMSFDLITVWVLPCNSFVILRFILKVVDCWGPVSNSLWLSNKESGYRTYGAFCATFQRKP